LSVGEWGENGGSGKKMEVDLVINSLHAYAA